MTSEQKEFIDFTEIKKIISVENEELFLFYLREVYKDLADRNEENRKKGIMKIVFFDYLKLPMFISEKVFTVCLLPLKTDRSKVEYKYQMQSLEEIGEIINSTFGKNKKLNLEEFQNMVEKHVSDIFIQIICFLYQKKPFTEKNINVLKASKKIKLPNDLIPQTPQVKNIESYNNILLPSPLKTTSLSPVSTLLEGFSIGSSLGMEEEPEPAISGFNGMVRYKNKIVPKKKDLNEKEEDDKDVNNVIKNSDLVYNSPSIYLKKNKKKVSNFSLNSPSPGFVPQSSCSSKF